MNEPMNMRSERVRAGLSAHEVAVMLHVSENSVLNWESGKYEPGGSKLKKLAEIYGCSVDYLLGLTAERVAR